MERSPPSKTLSFRPGELLSGKSGQQRPAGLYSPPEVPMRIWLALSAAMIAGAFTADTAQTAGGAPQAAPVGYTDTPMLPGGRWHVHDSRRPQPRAVAAGSYSSQDT